MCTVLPLVFNGPPLCALACIRDSLLDEYVEELQARCTLIHLL